MSQILDALPAQCANKILCCYRNSSDRLQTIKINNVPCWDFERVIFPAETLLFEATPKAILEIYGNDGPAVTLLNQFSCKTLQLQTFLDPKL